MAPSDTGHAAGGRTRAAVIVAAAILVAGVAGFATAQSRIDGRAIAPGTIGSAQVANGGLTGADIRNRGVTGADIRVGTLTGAHVRNGSLRVEDLAPSAVGALAGTPGPQGPPGPAGATGAPGPPGIVAPLSGTQLVDNIPGNSQVTVSSLSVPSSRYLLLGSVTFYSAGAALVVCSVRGDGATVGEAYWSTPDGPRNGPIAAQGVTAGPVTTVSFVCETQTSGAGTLQMGSLIAVPIG
jgi:hypothetical protein